MTSTQWSYTAFVALSQGLVLSYVRSLFSILLDPRKDISSQARTDYGQPDEKSSICGAADWSDDHIDNPLNPEPQNPKPLRPRPENVERHNLTCLRILTLALRLYWELEAGRVPSIRL